MMFIRPGKPGFNLISDAFSEIWSPGLNYSSKMDISDK